SALRGPGGAILLREEGRDVARSAWPAGPRLVLVFSKLPFFADAALVAVHRRIGTRHQRVVIAAVDRIQRQAEHAIDTHLAGLQMDRHLPLVLDLARNLRGV